MGLIDYWGAIVRKVDDPKDKRMRVDFKSSKSEYILGRSAVCDVQVCNFYT